eukprot:m.18218 g.18218  ORF g.18218 m.18218 type:complete len:763 (+) comp7725_c0_seq1:35-2323(+)
MDDSSDMQPVGGMSEDTSSSDPASSDLSVSIPPTGLQPFDDFDTDEVNDDDDDGQGLVGFHMPPKTPPANKWRTFSTIALAISFILVILVISLSVRLGRSSICSTPGCVNTASRLLNTIDSSADPCEDFYQYACGTWMQNHDIPDDRSSLSVFGQLYDNNLNLLRRTLEHSATDPTTSHYKSPTYYKACMNTTAKNVQAKPHFKKLTDELRSMASLDQKLAYLASLGVSAFVSIGVGSDDKDPSRNALFMSQGGLGLPSRDYYLDKEDDDPVLAAYRQYIREGFMWMGSDTVTASGTSTAVFDIEKQLAEIFVPKDDMRDPEAIYNPYTTAKIQQEAPMVDWQAAFDQIFSSKPPSTVTTFVLSTPSYIKNLRGIYDRFSSDAVANYLQWRLFSAYSSALDETVDLMKSDLRKALYGSGQQSPLSERCIESTDNALGFELGRLFVDQAFSPEAKQLADDMIVELRSAFNKRFKSVSWMDDATRSAATEKQEAINPKIGYPPFIMSDAELTSHYADLDISEIHFENILSSSKRDVSRNFLDLFKSPDRAAWDMTPSTVNAYYNPSFNEIVFPAGILQPPFFSTEQPNAINFGGMGVVIGHELSHGFDDQGRQYDKTGDLQPWWSESTVDAFKEHANCIVDQYSQYKVGDEHVNGKLTLGENIADNGGIHMAWNAYQSYRKVHGKEDPMPAISLTDEQLFFIGFAQVWCSKFTPEAAHQRILTDPHSPAMYRVLGTVSNSEEFAKAFQCSDTAKLNPQNKCRVW